MTAVRIRRFGDQIIFEDQTKGHFTQMPYAAAIEIGKALIAKGKEAEEEANAEGLIHDQALVLQTPVGGILSSHPVINKEAWRHAERNKLPGGIEPTSVVGAPAVIVEGS